ncbi:hypothetical protein [Paenibacillus zanthoxyli]|uniref:hypothetical protein n=1 Tax=Paenibacillus zanthoxyli TaxID=369399 RepID=UPI0018DD9334|nr:hypothetical protein [Paenibacillus zanthoxyli]
MSNNLYTGQHAAIVSPEASRWAKESLPQADYTIFVEFDDSNRLVLANPGGWAPPMLSGEFFADTEQGRKAVIGKEMIPYTQEISGSRYIDFGGNNYEVTGMLGAAYGSSADYLVLLHNPDFTVVPPESKMVVDSSEPSVVSQTVRRLMEQNPNVRLLESERQGLFRTAQVPLLYRLLVVEFYFLLLVSVVAFNRYWYETEKKYIFVSKLLGVSESRIVRQLLIKCSRNILMSGGFSLISLWLFGVRPLISIRDVVVLTAGFIGISWLFLGMIRAYRGVLGKRGVIDG